MEIPKPDGQPLAHETAPEPPADRVGIVLSRDLFFTDKVKGTAEALGFRMLAAGESSQARLLIEKWQPRVVFLDLTAGDVAAPASIAGYRQITGPGTWYVAAGPHVQADLLNAAREAGCQVVVPRSRFSAELPALIQRHFSRPADQPEPPG
ncbi:MAG: response regulator [Isosphaeraceae bacterium]